MYRLVRMLLFFLAAETAHRVVMRLLAILARLPGLCARLHAGASRRAGGELETTVAGLRLAHPIGLAAGLDKDAEAVGALFALGFSAVEIGTVTPRPQPGNPRPRLFRLPEHGALINRMGFNNEGLDAAAARLVGPGFRPGLLGVNLGKNKDTPLERAVDDYLAGVEALGPLADYVVVNASSPNTPGLRQLQEPERLRDLLTAVRARLDAVAPATRLFLKVAPDLTPEAVDAAVDVALACRVDGLVATNTTIERPVDHPLAAETGGLSGRPLAAASNRVITRAYRRARGALPIVGVGGVFTAEDAYAKIRAGASAVQVYTAFVYEGPRLVPRLVAGLRALLARDGLRSIAEAVGRDALVADPPAPPGELPGDPPPGRHF